MTDSAGISIDSLHDLLDFLDEPLKEAQKRWIEENQCNAKSFSALSSFNNNETKQTEIIVSLLEPTGKHGQGTLFLRHLLTKVWPFLKASNWSEQDLQRAIIYPNHYFIDKTGKPRLIDLWIQIDGDFCVAIESKAKGAVDQPGQVRAYLDYMKSKNLSDRYKLLYLSLKGCKPDETSIPPEEWDLECKADTAEGHRYADFIREWLTACMQECKADRIKFFIEDFIAFADPDDRRTSAMPAEIDPTVRSLLVNPADTAHRDTLLSIWELSEQINMEVMRIFQHNLCERLTEKQIKYTFGDDDGLLSKTEWGGFIKLPKKEFTAGGKRLRAYAEIQRCPSGSHATPCPHLIFGIHIDGLEDEIAELKPWRDHASSQLGEGTKDKNWVWQDFAFKNQNLRSKDTAIKLLAPQSADDIINRMQDVLTIFIETASEHGAMMHML